MIRTLQAEWIKLRTVLAHKILVVVAIVFPLAVGTLAATFGDIEGAPDSGELAEFVLGVSIVAAMLLGVVAVIALTSEYTHNTIRPTYAATPARVRVLASKLIVSSAATLAVGVLVVFGTWFATSRILSARDHSVSISAPHVKAVLISAVVLALLVTWFGFGIGLIIRNSPASVSTLLLWPLLIEGLLQLVFGLIGWDGAGKWVPYQAAINAAGLEPGDDSLGRPGGQIWFAVVGIALVAVGTWLDNRRDA